MSLRISTKGRYGTKALLDLAVCYGKGPVHVRNLAKSQRISERYLEQVLILLKVAGLVRSIRGAHGGFILARPPSEISLAEIIGAMEGSVSLVECVDHPGVCPHSARCVTRDMWVSMKNSLVGVLEAITLQDLAGDLINKYPDNVLCK
ncbi:MAG TPA: Rrf2 family transcriptional regulator [Dehalococcoidia bacterium]|nr:Rrf2 family transcriptional regulator [Dehalococcoidia bacterium]